MVICKGGSSFGGTTDLAHQPEPCACDGGRAARGVWPGRLGAAIFRTFPFQSRDICIDRASFSRNNEQFIPASFARLASRDLYFALLYIIEVYSCQVGVSLQRRTASSQMHAPSTSCAHLRFVDVRLTPSGLYDDHLPRALLHVFHKSDATFRRREPQIDDAKKRGREGGRRGQQLVGRRTPGTATEAKTSQGVGLKRLQLLYVCCMYTDWPLQEQRCMHASF